MAKRRARNQAKESVWRRRLAGQADSGQSVRAWCRRHRLKEAAFHWWRRELAQVEQFWAVSGLGDSARAVWGQKS
jgi:hypothetical protein